MPALARFTTFPAAAASLVGALLLGLFGAGAGPGLAGAETVTLRAHHFLPPSSTTHADFLVPWAQRVERDSDGRLAIEIFPAMQLGGSPPGLYDQARDGVVDIVWTLPGYTPGRFPRLEVFELPFMAASAEATSQAVQAFHERRRLEELADVHVLLLHTHAPGTFHLRDEPVRRLEDLAGRRLRAPTRVTNDALAALGAVPVGMPVPQVPEALSRGVIDGTVIPWEVARALRVHELVDHHAQAFDERGFYTAVFLLAMNKATYDGLPEALRAVLDSHSGLALAREMGRVWDRAEADGRQAAIERGNDIVRLDAAELDRWRAATAPVIEAWINDMAGRGIDGAALVEQARSLVASFAGEQAG